MRLGDAKAAADEYLAWCRENDYIPKFNDWADHPNYYKMLEDFTCYDNGTAVPQGDVKLVLPGAGDAFGSFSDLIRMGLEEDAILQGKQDAAIPEIVNAIKAELPEYEASAKKPAKKKKAGDQFQLRGNPNAEVGININDSTQAFTEEILKGDKTIETRNSPTLDEYIGQRVGIVRTGKNGAAILVGYATIAGRVDYTSEKQFRDDYQKHRVNSKDPKFGWKGKTKYGYILENVEREANPYAVTDRDPGNYTARDVTRDIQQPTEKQQKAAEKFRRDNNPYSYKNLIAKGDMHITSISTTVNDRDTVIKNARANALAYGHLGPYGETLVNVPDIGVDVIVGTKGIRHGIDRRIVDNGPATEKIGELLHNAVCVNELSPGEGDKQKLSYVLIAAAKDENNHPHIVEMVVDKHTNELNEVNTLYSVNKKPYTNKKESAGLKAPRFPGLPATFTDSDLTIKQLLDFVNAYFPDIMSESVYREYKHTERPEGILGQNAQFQRRNTERSDAQVLAEAFDDSAVTATEQRSLASFRAQLEAYEAAELKVSNALKENRLSDNAVTRKALQQARSERNSASKILNGMVTNNADLKKVIKAERAIMADGTAQLRREFNREYRQLNKIINGLESERREDIQTAYNGILEKCMEQTQTLSRF